MMLSLDKIFNSQSLNIAKHQMHKRMLPFPTQKATADSHHVSGATTTTCGTGLRGTGVLTASGDATTLFQFKSH